MTSVTVIGLGAMGIELAHTLLDNGYSLTVWNRTPEKAGPILEAGATLASSASEAIDASDIIITCIRSHADTRQLLEGAVSSISGKTFIELSTGDSAEASSLMAWIRGNGAECVIGMISVFPKDIGKPDSAILAVASEKIWQDVEKILQTLAGKSALLGDDPIALAAIYASLVLPRQSFMFGMIYGALLCQKSGISMDTYVEVLPLTIKIVHDYYDLFAATVPDSNYSNPPASLGVYHAAFEDVIKTCRDLGTPEELPALLHDLLQRGVDAGLADQQVTSLLTLMGDTRGLSE